MVSDEVIGSPLVAWMVLFWLSVIPSHMLAASLRR